MSTRILLTCEDYFPYMGGAEVCVHNIRKHLNKKGYTVTLFTNTTDTTDDEENIVRQKWSFSVSNLWKHITVLHKLIREHDVVHCQYSFRLACICAPLAKLTGTPMLLTQQGRGIVPEAHTKWQYWLFYKICQYVSMWGAHHITVTSEEIGDLTAGFVARKKITSVPNGYDADMFHSDPSLPVPAEVKEKKHPVLLTIRRLVPKNGIHILIQALALVKKQNPNFHYIAIGEGRMRPIIEQSIKELELENHVTLLGSRHNSTLPSFYQHSDLVLVPSSAEATSIACIEAMGMGKPIIASRVGGLIDLLGKDEKYGTLVQIYGTEACNYDAPLSLPEERLQVLAGAIVAFLNNPKPFKEKATSAKQHSELELSWSAITGRYISLYSQLLS